MSVPVAVRNAYQQKPATTSGTTQAAMTRPVDRRVRAARLRPRSSSAISRPSVFCPMTAEPTTKTRVSTDGVAGTPGPERHPGEVVDADEVDGAPDPVNGMLVKAV